MNLSFLSIFKFDYPKEYTLTNFSHTSCELIYFINGKGTTVINNTAYTYKQNSICFTKSRDVRNHFCSVKTDYLCIRFKEPHHEITLESGVYQLTDDYVYQLFLQILNECKEKQPYYSDYCTVKTSQILLHLMRNHKNSSKDSTILDLVHKIDETFIPDISLTEMAELCNYSYDHFRHKFKSITGSFPSDYLMNKRVEYACKLLSESKYNCTQISNICGFSSPSQFSSMFKKQTGITPNQYANYIH